MKRILILNLTIMVLFVFSGFCEEEHYVVKFGKEIKTNKVIYSGNKIITYNEEFFQKFEISETYETISWEFTNFSRKEIISGKKEGNVVKLNKKVDNKTLSKEHVIGEIPWYQSFDNSLKKLIYSENNEIEFWLVNPANLEISKMKAIKEIDEYIEISNRKFNTIRIRVYIDGPASVLGSIYYWYNKSNKELLRYKSDFKIPIISFNGEKVIN